MRYADHRRLRLHRRPADRAARPARRDRGDPEPRRQASAERRPPEDGVRADRRPRSRRRPRSARAREARRAHPPRLPAQPHPRRGADVRHRRQRDASRCCAPPGDRRRPRAGDLLGDGLRRFPRQPGADHRGLARPGRPRLLLRPRQDRGRPRLPALGRGAPRPRDDDRAAVHRVRPERRQLHLAQLEEQLVHAGDRRGRRRSSSSSTRTTWSGADRRCSTPRRGRPFNLAGDGTHDLARVGRDHRAQDPRDEDEDR